MAKKSGHYRSSITGRYVTSRHSQRSPRTTLFESGGQSKRSGGVYRSAISGRYVTAAYARRSPRTTVKES